MRTAQAMLRGQYPTPGKKSKMMGSLRWLIYTDYSTLPWNRQRNNFGLRQCRYVKLGTQLKGVLSTVGVICSLFISRWHGCETSAAMGRTTPMASTWMENTCRQVWVTTLTLTRTSTTLTVSDVFVVRILFLAWCVETYRSGVLPNKSKTREMFVQKFADN